MTKPLDMPRFIAGLHDYIGKALAPVVQRLKALEERETKGFVDLYRGSWQPNISYTKGSMVTFQGSLWLALSASEGRPGNSPSWRLIVRGTRE